MKINNGSVLYRKVMKLCPFKEGDKVATTREYSQEFGDAFNGQVITSKLEPLSDNEPFQVKIKTNHGIEWLNIGWLCKKEFKRKKETKSE